MSGKQRRTALVLASSSGLGFAVAKALYRDGHHVIITGRSKKLDKAKQEICHINREAEVLAIPSDVTKIEDLDNLVTEGQRHFGKIDILFTNVPGPRPGTVLELNLADFNKAHNDILLPVVYLAKRLIPDMLFHKWGRIIMNTSITAKEPASTLALSNVYRAGLASLSKTLSFQLAAEGITVNTVGPASFRTDRALQLLQDMSIRQGRPVEEIEQENAERLPMRRYNDPMEFGNVVAFLASDAASALTGAFIAVDGGISHSIF